MDLLQNILDTSHHAIFTVDRSGIVTHINRQAKERFGLFNHSRFSHGPGRVRPGDIVVLATTAIGVDDGALRVQDLAAIGLRDKKLRPGDRLVAVGNFKDPLVRPVYKFLRTREDETLELDTVFRGIPLHLHVGSGVARVEVRGQAYELQYFRSIGQMVVIDRQAEQVKFWEENGYSARREGIGDLLRGATFTAKSPDTQVDVVGYHFREFFEGAVFEEHLHQIMEGFVTAYEDQEYEINGFVLTASLLPVTGEDGTVEGVIVKFRNIADIRATIMERNAAIRSAERQYRANTAPDLIPDNSFTSLFGNSTAMTAVRRQARKLSRMDCHILLLGENGTGKTELAQAIGASQSRIGPVFSVDCTTLSEDNWERELFGSSMTFSDSGKTGIFQKANGGTVLLDEIGQMPLPVQYKLWQVVQDKAVCPAGSDTPYAADVRILATSSKDLKELMTQGKFRSDLYYALNAFSLALPPLRQCREDIPFLINDIVERVRQQYELPEKYLSGEAFSMLLSYDWPGNIRELEHVLQRALTLSEGDIVYPEHIRLEVSSAPLTLRQQLKDTEKRIILQTLQMVSGDKKKAQELLGLSRTVFYDKLKEHHLH